MSRRNRRKGLVFEREVAIAFRAAGFPAASRHLEFQSHHGGQGIDLEGVGPYRVQCKKLRQYASVATIEEVKCERWLGEVPILVTAGDNKEPMAVLPLEELMRLIKFRHT